MSENWKLVEKDEEGEIWMDEDGNLWVWVAGDDVWLDQDDLAE